MHIIYYAQRHGVISFRWVGDGGGGVCERIFVFIHKYICRFSVFRCVLWRNGYKPNGLLINQIRRRRNKPLASWRPRLRNRYDLDPKSIIYFIIILTTYDWHVYLYSVSWGSRMPKWSKQKRHASRNGWPTNWETWRLRTSTLESKITSATSSWSCSGGTWPNWALTKWPWVLAPGHRRRAPARRPCTGPTVLAQHSEWKASDTNN